MEDRKKKEQDSDEAGKKTTSAMALVRTAPYISQHFWKNSSMWHASFQN